MKLYLSGHDYKYAVEQTMLVLLPDQRPEYSDLPPEPDEAAAWSTLLEQEDVVTAVTKVAMAGRTTEGTSSVSTELIVDQLTRDRMIQRILKQSFYKACVQHLEKKPDWGALTGIRPAKLFSRALEEGKTVEEAVTLFEEEYFVSPQRTRLAKEAAITGLEIKESLRPNELSLYIGIPFCPTRCAYCSFVSADVKKALNLLEPFLDALEKEIDATAELLPKAGVVIRSIYMGGGTPTTLSAEQMDRLLAHIRKAFDLSHLTEFTVEAGRPDTITPEKMAVLKKHGVDRVSVNPQSMEDHVLKAMGRAHSAADILTAYQSVRAAQLPAVNMDLIAGLPKDTVSGFQYTLDTVLAMDPENITVHTLALKKGSRLMLEPQALPSGEETAQMLDYAWNKLEAAGYRPYYLYRQKYMSGALENIGWCKPGYEGFYNVCIMEELHTILALGAGGSTKMTDPATGKITRMANPKYPFEYINRIQQICQDKESLLSFYADLFHSKQ